MTDRGLRAAAVPVRTTRCAQGCRRSGARRHRRLLDRNAVRSRSRRSRRVRLRACSKRRWAIRRRRAAPTLREAARGWLSRRLRRRGRPASRSARASGPRSSSRRCRTCCDCARRPGTPSCTRPSRTRRTRWARRWRDVERYRSRSTPTGTSISTPSASDDAARALLLWVNEPGNPTSSVADDARFRAIAAWARARGVVVASDECYVEFAPEPATILSAGTDGRARGAQRVEALQPGRHARRLLCRRSGARRPTWSRPASTRG